MRFCGATAFENLGWQAHRRNKRTRSKWSRALRYAVAYKPDSEPLDRLVRRKGGVNECAARFGWCLGVRGPKTFGQRVMALTANRRDPTIYRSGTEVDMSAAMIAVADARVAA
jgi:hypothetical protein